MSLSRVEQVTWEEKHSSLSTIRNAVFVEEQQVPVELELDEHDPIALHALAYDHEGKAVGTARLMDSGKIGRMAVLKSARGQGVGSELLKFMTRLSLDALGKPPYLEAQLHAIAFYEAHGYVAEGSVYLDAGIEHRLMRYHSEA